MPSNPDLFKTAPAEVVRYFRAKQSIPTFDWRDIAPAEHAYSWTVAKTAGFDVLEDLRAAVDAAIVNRVPFEEFRQQLTPTLQAKGWWGRRIVEDPRDGVPKIVQLGSPRRLRTIYWANVRTAHAAGEWERTQRTKRFLPFLAYTLSQAERRRLEHEGWVGTVLPVDDPWWDTHYPPNGWGCKCGVRQVSGREAERLGWTENTTSPDPQLRPWRNKRTGQTVMVPTGIDPGWDTNPGKHRARNLAELLSDRIDRLPLRARPAAIADLVASPAFKHFVNDAITVGAERAKVVGGLRAQGIKGLDLESRLDADFPFAMTRYPVAVAVGRYGDEFWPVMIDAKTIGHAADHRSKIDTSRWHEIQAALNSGKAKRDGNTIRVFDPATGLFFVLTKLPDREVWRLRTLFKGANERYFAKQTGEEM